MYIPTPVEQVAKRPRNINDNYQSNEHMLDKQDMYQDTSDEIQNPAFQKGILKYFKKVDYFLAGNTPGDASKDKGIKYEEAQNDVSTQNKQGTFLGVFLPVMQNIFGVLLFIRVPQITGEAGIIESVVIVVICCCTTFLTVLSLSAIATNGKIFRGGTYYLISRNMGAPIGTAVGFCFYLGTTFGGAMYILGAAESFITATKLDLGSTDLSMRLYGTILLVLIMIINLVGLKYVAKTGLLFLGVVILAIISIYIGFFATSGKSYENGDFPDMEEKYQYAAGITGIGEASTNWENNKYSRYIDNNFFILLSIYFPSVTGIMAGANRSGDLKDPSSSLPKGTVCAQLITSFVYISSPILFGLVCDRNTLQSQEYLIAAEISWPTRYLTIVAIVLSSTGAGLQCLAGAPRILDAIVEDDNLTCCKCFKNRIKRIIVLTCLISLCAIMIGDIDAITPIITMFFLLCYGFVNFCCLFLDTVQFPNWRPTWKFYHKFLSFLGLGLCIFLMIAISWWSFIIVVILVVILFVIVYKTKDEDSNYGDSIDAVRLIQAKSSLIGLIKSTKHVKNWIPIVLVVGDFDINKPHDEQLDSKGALFFLESIKKDISFIVYGNYLTGNYTYDDLMRKEKQEEGIAKWMKKEKIQVINKTVMYKEQEEIPSYLGKQEKEALIVKRNQEPHQGMLFLMQAAGLGGLEPNTIVTEFPKNFKLVPKKADQFVQFVAFGVRMGKAIMVTVNDQNFAPKMEIISDQEKQAEAKRSKQEIYQKSIDVWTFSYENGLMILMTYFLNRSTTWGKCPINIYILTLKSDDKKKKEEEEQRIQNLVVTFLKRYRLYQQKMTVNVEIVSIDQWQQIEGLLLTEGKRDQLEKYPDQFKNIPVDPTQTYGMDLHDNLSKKSQQQQVNNNNNNNLLHPEDQQQPARALSVMSQTQVNMLNNNIKSKSGDADLVIMNLPEPVNQKAVDYMEYVRNMTQGLQRVLLIRNTKQDCITEFT